MGSQYSYEDLKIGTFVDTAESDYTKEVVAISPKFVRIVHSDDGRYPSTFKRAEAEEKLLNGLWLIVDKPTPPASTRIIKAQRQSFWGGVLVGFFVTAMFVALPLWLWGFHLYRRLAE